MRNELKKQCRRLYHFDEAAPIGTRPDTSSTEYKVKYILQSVLERKLYTEPLCIMTADIQNQTSVCKE